MHLNLPKKSTFWASVVLAALGVIAGALHQLANINILNLVGFFLVLAAFILVFLGLTVKGF